MYAVPVGSIAMPTRLIRPPAILWTAPVVGATW